VFRVAGWKDENDDSAPEEFDGAGKFDFTV
jgi:hypothetical protein